MCQSINRRKQAKLQNTGTCAPFLRKKAPQNAKKQMEKPSALFVTLHFALFVVLTVMRCGTIVAVCHCDGCKLAVVVFAVMATSAHVTTDCLLVLHSSTSFFKLSVHNYTAKNTPFVFLFANNTN